MAFETGIASTQQDLIQKLFTFATANGWTQNDLNTGSRRASLERGDLHVHFQWDGTDHIAMYQSTGFTNGNDPWDHPGDSGNGMSGTTVLNRERSVNNIGNGPYTAYYFYADASPSYHIYVVLEYAAGLFRHFGFGQIDKIGDWTGGEFVGGHYWDDDDSSIDNPTDNDHSVLLDAAFGDTSSTNERRAATIRIEGFSGQPAGSKYGQVWSLSIIGNNDADGQTKVPVLGGIRGSIALTAFGHIRFSNLNGFTPLVPIPIIYRNTAVSPDIWQMMGTMPNIRHMQMGGFSAGAEFTNAGDTWQIFPVVRKRDEGDNNEESEFAGIAYKKVT